MWEFDYSTDDGPMVCVTHRRFVPCRSDEGCVLATDPYSVAFVRAYHDGGGVDYE